MTAEEIRDIHNTRLGARAVEEFSIDPAATFLLMEVAAQLAELNANLRLIFHVPKPELYNPGSPGPRLTIDKLD